MSQSPFRPPGQELQSAGGLGFGRAGPAAYGWAATPPPTPGPDELRRPSRARRWAGLAVVVVLLLVAAGIAVSHWRAGGNDHGGVSLVTPAKLPGRPRLRDPEVDRLVGTLVARFGTCVPLTSHASGAAYGDRSRDLVVIVSAYRASRDPQGTLDDVVEKVNAGVQKITHLATADPGPLGGVAYVGDVVQAPTDIAVCIWADQASVGLVFFYYRTRDDVRAEFVSVRSAVERCS